MNCKSTALSILFIVATFMLQAQDKFCRTWYTQEKASKVQIYLAADGKYYGKIVWLRDGFVDGKPLVDTENPDKTKRNEPWLGLVIITGLQKKSETEFVSGKIYDPTKGNYYNCKMTVRENGNLDLRGYILGMPFLGRTTTWYPAEETPAAAQQKTVVSSPSNTTDKKKVNP
jgi:uncharacterized protein (DUF2147 family)